MRVKTYHSDTSQTSQRFNVFCVLDVLLKISNLRCFYVKKSDYHIFLSDFHKILS